MRTQTTISGRSISTTIKSNGSVVGTFEGGSTKISSVVAARGLPGNSADSPSYGFAVYNDTEFTQASPQVFPSGERTLLKIDGLSSLVDHLSPPFVGADLWASNRLQGVAIGNVLDVRLSFQEMSAVQSNSATIDLDIGGSVGVIWSQEKDFGASAGEPRSVSFGLPVYQLETFVANGGGFFITPDSDCEIWGSTIFIVPISA